MSNELQMESTYTEFKRKPQEKRLLKRTRCKLQDAIKTDFRKFGYDGVNRIKLAHHRVQQRISANTNTIINLQFHRNKKLVVRATLHHWVVQICFSCLYQTVSRIRTAQQM